MSYRSGDSLDVYGGGRPPPRSQGPPPSSFSGVSIVQPPGGASSISLGGGYGERAPSPQYGRRSSQPSQAPYPQQQYAQQQYAQQQQQQQQQHSSPAAGSPAAPRAGRRGRRDQDTPDCAPQQQTRHSNGHFGPGNGGQQHEYHQHYMGGKNITQSPGGNSSISFGSPPVAPPPSSRQEPPRGSGYHQPEYNSAPPPQQQGYQQGGYCPPGAASQPPHPSQYDQQQSRGAQQYPTHDNGDRSRHVPNQSASPYAGTPPRGPHTQATRTEGAYQQHHMGGKNIVQSPGGASSISLSWGHEPDAGRSHARQSPQAPSANYAGHYAQHSPQPAAGYAPPQSRDNQPSGRYQSPELQSVPTPYNPYQNNQSPARNSSHVTQPPGGHSSLNVFG